MTARPSTLALLRHPTPLAPAGRCYGRLDLALAPGAAAETAALVAALAGMVRPQLWSSPARRCREPAAEIAARIGAPLVIDDRLAELDFGAWEGRLWDEVERAELDRWALDPLGFAPPGGESGAALIARVRAFYTGLPAADCIVMTHGGPLKVLGALARGGAVDLLAAPPPFGSVSLFASPC